MLHSLNINVPYTYCIHDYNDNLIFFDEIKRSAKAKRYMSFMQEVDSLIEFHQFKHQHSKKRFCGIFQEKIEGDVPFREVPQYIKDSLWIDKSQVAKALQNPRKASVDVVQTVNAVQTDISEKLDYFLNIPSNHYKKFISDAFKINNQQICIDNVTKENFIYNKDNGFYFLDLGALEYKNFSKEEKEFLPLFCTIDNVLEQVFYPVAYFSDEHKQKYAQLYIKLHKCLADVYIDNISDKKITKTIKKYCDMRNNYGGIYYQTFFMDLPEDIKQACKKETNYIESLLQGNTLSSGKELDI